MLDVVKQVAPAIPFDVERLDRLMDEAGAALRASARLAGRPSGS